MRSFQFTNTALVIATLLIASPAIAQSTSPPSPGEHQQHAAQAPESTGPDRSMMQKHQEMMAGMKALDTKIESLIAKMNSAKGEEQISAVVELLNAMADKQKAMHECMAMHGEMPPMMGAGHKPPAP